MKNNLNEDAKRRDEIIFVEKPEDVPAYCREYLGGCRRFHKLSLSQLKTLIEEKFIDLNECHNDSPSTEVFLNFLETHPDFVLEGYVISVDRLDYRTTIDGIRLDREASKEEILDFTQFSHADEFDVTKEFMRAWWD